MADSLKEELTAAQNASAAPAANNVAQSAAAAAPAYADQSRINAINQMYDSNINAQRTNLQSSYDQNMSNLEANRESIAKRYQQQRNAAATDYERQRRNFNEQAMMNGLGTGVGTQAALAQNAAYQKQQGTINAAEGTDVSTLERNIADLKVKYQNDINSAVADNDYKRAAALLDEYNNAYSRAMNDAQIKAQYGDFSGYASIYGESAANQMRNVWMRQNPGIAYSLGYINAQTYYSLTGQYPPGYKAPSTGKKFSRTASLKKQKAAAEAAAAAAAAAAAGGNNTSNGMADASRLSGTSQVGNLEKGGNGNPVEYTPINLATGQPVTSNWISETPAAPSQAQILREQYAAPQAAAQAAAEQAAAQRAAEAAAVASIGNYNYDGSLYTPAVYDPSLDPYYRPSQFTVNTTSGNGGAGHSWSNVWTRPTDTDLQNLANTSYRGQR